ncbi:hypothetical protein [Hoylesella timonensis]|uniref:hypothetical protein n=1 Tax=Hoylesella timonensis TaxID=386414 RepID=UPI003013C7CB
MPSTLTVTPIKGSFCALVTYPNTLLSCADAAVGASALSMPASMKRATHRPCLCCWMTCLKRRIVSRAQALQISFIIIPCVEASA